MLARQESQGTAIECSQGLSIQALYCRSPRRVMCSSTPFIVGEDWTSCIVLAVSRHRATMAALYLVNNLDMTQCSNTSHCIVCFNSFSLSTPECFSSCIHSLARLQCKSEVLDGFQTENCKKPRICCRFNSCDRTIFATCDDGLHNCRCGWIICEVIASRTCRSRQVFVGEKE